MTNVPSEHDGPLSASGAGSTYSGSEFETAPISTQGYSEGDLDTTPVAPASGAQASWPPADEPSTTDVAKGEAGKVKDTAVEAGQNVAATAKDEVANVAAETKQQAKSLIGSVTGEVQAQAGAQQQKIASSVHALSKELGGMASGTSEGGGPLTDLAQQAAQRGGEIAHWLENHEPRDVLREVTSFGRRRPVMFLALCGLAGVVAGRLTRGAVAANTSVDSPSGNRGDLDVDGPRRALGTASYGGVPVESAGAPTWGYGPTGDPSAPVDPAGYPTEYPADRPGFADPLAPVQPTTYPTQQPGGPR